MPLFCWGGMAAPTGATAKLLTMLCWVSVVAQIEVLQRLALTKSLCQSYSKSPETKNRSELQLFLRLAIVASSPIANRGTKTQVICRVKAPFSLCGDREEFAIAKKLQRCRVFCFHDGWIVPTGRFHDGRITATGGYRNGRITATGQITQMCVFSAAARVATSRATDRTKRPLCLAGSGWAAARVQRGFAADWTERQPLGLEAAGEGRLWIWLA